MKKKKKKRRSYTPLFLSALLLSGATVGGSVLLSRSAASQPHELSTAAGKRETYSLWTEAEEYTAEREAEAVFSTPKSEEKLPYVFDELLAEEDGLSIFRIHGKDYRGVLAIVEDPTRLFVGTLDYYGAYGLTIDQFMERNGAILGTNGGEFSDPNGEGDGSTPLGIVMTDGEYRWGGRYGEYDCLGITEDGRLITGRRTGEYLESQNVKYAISFGPGLIVDGVIQSERLYVGQPEPRTAIGQRENGQVIILIVEGRQVGSLGVDLPTLARIMSELGAVNATNLDGGASSALDYRGTLMNRPNGLGGMRPMPSALLLRGKEETAE